ncbi:TonB-dependent receptor [Parahaliea mediterranea]|uniref:TonB-dependent receptor n=1 Tax=Parahaliea mediterranea TaxID=651086 RepID=A0A939IMB1_9GAMM|nr:TonB-dependent receptor [Parahaliea mediterranea]MBN7796848.1 TonB-dependent receptor [Parahaliea mediterranea]
MSNKTPIFRLQTAASVVALMGSLQSAQAAEGAPVLLEEVIVTAQKREQSAQDIPVSIFAITGQTMEERGVLALEDLRDQTAGLELVSTSPGKLSAAIRGVTSSDSSLDGTGAVGYYVDEVPISSYAGSLPEVAMWDAQHVEVLRGPQGTLFGEGSMAGTIRVISNKPDTTATYGRISTQYQSVDGGEGGWGLKGVANLPLSEQWAARLSFTHQDLGGWVDAPELNKSDTNTNESLDARLGLRYEGERATVDLAYLHHSIELGNTWGQTSPSRVEPSSVEVQPGSGIYFSPIRELSTLDDEYDIYNITVNYDFGEFSLVSASSYFDQDSEEQSDLSPNDIVFFGVPGVARSTETGGAEEFTQELRLQSNGDQRLDWLVGGFYKTSEREFSDAFYFSIPAWGFEEYTTLQPFIEREVWALFAEIDYAFDDNWSLQLGGRYYEDDIERYSIDDDSVVFGTVAGRSATVSGSSDHFSPKMTLTWQNDDLVFYATVANGFRSGGINEISSLYPQEVPDLVGPEELWAYELGAKSSLADGAVTLNAYVYHNSWDDIILGLTTSDALYAFRDNAGKAESTGGEVELTWAINEVWRWSVNSAYVESEIKDDVYDSFGGVVVQSGAAIANVPEFTAGTTLDARWPLVKNWEGSAVVTYAYRDKTYSDSPNTPRYQNDAYNMVNFRLGADRGDWAVFLYGRNLFNEEATTQRWSPGFDSQLVYSNYIQPRTLGVELQYNTF